MSKLSDLKSKIHALSEIQSILGAMKNLAIIEMSKISKLVTVQEKIFETVNMALADFDYFNSLEMAANSGEEILCLLIGSERGFCGPFNEQVISQFKQATADKKNIKVIIVGRKLAFKLQKESLIEFELEGPNSTDEIPAIMNSLLAKLLPFADRKWLFIHHDGNGQGAIASYPIEDRVKLSKSFLRTPPVLTMSPQELQPQMLEQLLFSVIHRALYNSFLAENRERLRHMQGAITQIDKKLLDFSLKLNEQRQEEITEELEILMLSSLDDKTVS